ncbi:receptor-type tyrosine-protein phosphatase F-like [Ylistrum balloti]|uniref:receptor-type tyrosine-protein phosphatase F-like n=1 Tax=Ylistrum balloti TaxID=509963 RepID=UPI002905A0B1|nr:receptor-type tyrosine-protein phosphatase F-like [Ylistrum balloti]
MQLLFLIEPATPLGFTATDVDGPQITLSWTNAIGIRTRYDVTTSPVLSPSITTSNSITYSSGVTDGQRYNITITTVSGTELSDPLEATFRTVSKTPDPPTTPTCSETTDMSITLTWTAPSFPKGDVQYYVVNSVTTNAMFTTTSSLAQYTVTGLQPATNYAFRVATVNDAVSPHSNQSSFSTQVGCWTRAAMSQEPNTLIVSQEQSRQFTLNWTKPSITNGNLNGYRLTVFEGSTCVQEVIFKCETCTGFTSFVHTSSCQLTAKQSVVIPPADIEGYTYTVENLNPYINYTIHVLGVNAAGDGHPNIMYGMTKQEVPQNPTALTAEVLSSTEIRVSWAISDPEPGPTSYTLYIIPESPEQIKTITIQGFSTRTYNVTSLQEYRIYQFNLTASTVLGTAVFQQSLPSAKTNAAAPGQVSNFQVVRPDGPNFITVMVSWELPAILDRNSDIIKYMFSHNSTGGNMNSAPEEILISGNIKTVKRNLEVVPHNTYYIEVYAVGTDTDGILYIGQKSISIYLAPITGKYLSAYQAGIVARNSFLL